MSSENGFDDLSLSDNDEPVAPAPKTKLAPLAAVPTVEDDEEPVYVPDEPSPDPWRSPDPYPAASLTSRQPSDEKEAAASPLGAPSRGKQRAEARTGDVPIILGVAVVDFNHLIGPTVEFAYPPSLEAAIEDDQDLSRLLPFLALPDGAHLSEEDYSYFHCLYSPSTGASSSSTVPSNTTLFGISCNRQLASKELLYRPEDVTRTTVQKAVVVMASQPVFGPIRDKLGVVTRAFFAQRDFSQTGILKEFYDSLEEGLIGKDNETFIAMGTSLRELIHKFRHRTLIMLKMLMLQKRIMLFGYPVEKLCTYQYSLLSLMPGLLLELQDSGSPDLDIRPRRPRPTSFKSSDRRSLLRYMGLPLHLFGKDAFFQPYLPLQQVDMLYAKTWLTGTTNQIVTQQKDCKYDLLVNIDTMTFEFADPKLERIVALTAADRRWMDDVVRTVEETWDLPDVERSSFRGSDDDLRARFEEYICAALASLKLEDFVRKGKQGDTAIVGIGQFMSHHFLRPRPDKTGAEQNVLAPFSEAWLKEFKLTSAYETWDACTDPVLFDICEPKHPCEVPVNVVSDLGLRLTEGMHDLKLDQHLATGRDAVASAFVAGSSSLFKAFDGVRTEVSSRLKEREAAAAALAAASPPPSAAHDAGRRGSQSTLASSDTAISSSTLPVQHISKITSSSSSSTPAASRIPIQAPQIADVRATLGNIGSGIGSFFGSRVASFRAPAVGATPPAGGVEAVKQNGLRPMSLSGRSLSDRARQGGVDKG
ncbi:putative cytoplasm protein [Dioszegia hungarica]|uniref:Cytoplasm protein n=1 Tax=Dioszegia hungarica TaxID=4972 RepID=A0AA38H7R4_9TREE|nr:putative cytoplasm protein [Dioszegia hungarica]KAI9633849.1 putative cytoplasm protein [Dioszegia hungarica]